MIRKALLGLALLGVILLARLTYANTDSELDLAIQKSIQLTWESLLNSQPYSTAEDLAVVYSAIAPIANSSQNIYKVKILDANSGRIFSYWYDHQLNPITELGAFQKRAAAYEAVYGKLSQSLYERMVTVESPVTVATVIPVAIWAEQAPADIVDTQSFGAHMVYLPLVTSGALSPVQQIMAYLDAHQITVDYVSYEAPVVYAQLPTTLLWELQSQTYIAAIYEQEYGYPMMSSAARTTAAPWTWSRGITGSGIKVAVLEDDGVAFNNPNIDGSQYYIGWWKRIGSHATQVAGVIASNDETHRGIAYDAEILSANALNYWESSIIAAADWAIDTGSHIINASFGTNCPDTAITSMDKYFDWIVWEKRKTVTVSAGNLNPNCMSNYNVSSPGKAYNVITVGAKDDMNTAETEEDVADDRFSNFSRYVDPVTATENRLKPEVVAVGQRITSTSTESPWIETSEVAGTSFSAPIVAGQAALMMQRAEWLTYSPEAVKAGIMATARWTNLRDDVNPNNMASIDKMGVGAVDTTAADNSLINGRIQELYLQQSDFNNGQYDIYFDGLAGQRIRVVIVWSSHPSKVVITNWILHDRLESDFDLTVRAPNGQIFGSYADEANYEIVEFIAPEGGSYRVRIHLSRWDDSSMEERVGFSWYSGDQLP